jgi:WD40 repeat protein
MARKKKFVPAATGVSASATSLPAPEVPQELTHACRNGECVLFAGTGLGARAGLPTRRLFLSGLLAIARDNKLVDPSRAASLEGALVEGERNAVADSLMMAFASHRDILQDYLLRSFPNLTTLSTAHQVLSQISFNSVVTTNYDTLLEKAFPEYARAGLFTIQETESLLDALAQKRQFILKLYGIIERPETLIFSPIEYREAVASNLSFLKFMEGYFFSRSFFFIGLSLGGIQDFLSSISFRGMSPRQHFALAAVAGSAWSARADLLLRRFNVQVIPFSVSDTFPELDPFLRDLSYAARPVAVAPGVTAEPLATSTPGLRRIVLEDIGPFDRLELDFSKEKNWKILLGDNGVGKSTILKAIATAIIGDDARSYASRLVRAGKTRGRITLITEQNPSGYVTEILTKDVLSEAEVLSIPSRPMEAEGWLALGFSPLRVVSWSASAGPQPMVQKGRPTADDLIPLLSGDTDPRMDRLKQWIVNLDAAYKTSHLMGLQELRTFHGPKGAMSSVAFSADGRFLVSGSIDKTVRVWDLVSGREIRTIKAHGSGVNAVALSGDSKLLATGSHHGSVKVWDLVSGSDRELSKFENHSQVFSVAISMDSRWLVAGSEDGSVGVWDRSTSSAVERRFRNHTAEVWSVALSGDGHTLVSGSEDGSVRVWDVVTGQERRALTDRGSAVWSVALSADGNRVVAGSNDGLVRVWDVASGKEVRTLENLKDEVMSLACTPDGSTVAAGFASGNVKVWDLQASGQTGIVRAHRSAIWFVALSLDGHTLATASEDKTVKLWSVSPPDSTLSPIEAIKKFFDVIGTLTDRTDIDFLRVTETFRVIVKVADVVEGVPVELLSQGLTSLLGWIGVLCQRLKETLQSPTNDPLPTNSYALVLIDELDAHMHPRWQQVLVPRLKQVFPNVQFIACTHSPLIVGGLDKDEVVRFAMRDGKIAKVDFDPDMTLGRTDQILTSELFDLSTTLDQATQAVMTEYQTLLGKNARSPQEQEKLSALARSLEERIPLSPSNLIERRSAELLELMQAVDLKPLDDTLRSQIEEHLTRLSKSLRREAVQ